MSDLPGDGSNEDNSEGDAGTIVDHESDDA